MIMIILLLYIFYYQIYIIYLIIIIHIIHYSDISINNCIIYENCKILNLIYSKKQILNSNILIIYAKKIIIYLFYINKLFIIKYY